MRGAATESGHRLASWIIHYHQISLDLKVLTKT